jgi:hypothetical protein
VRPVVLTDLPQLVPVRVAARFIRAAECVAVLVTTGAHGGADLRDTSKARVLKMIRRRDQVWLSEVFGTVVMGRPEPVLPCCGEMAALLAG